MTTTNSLRRYVPLLLGAVAGVTVTAILFFVFLGFEESRLRADFEATAGDRVQAIRSGLAEDAAELDLLATLAGTSEDLAAGRLGEFAREFERLAQGILREGRRTETMAFAARVTGAERTAFSTRARAQVSGDFQILRPDAGGDLVPADTRSEYWPILAVRETAATGMQRGLDIGSVAEIREAIRKALAGRTIVASDAVALTPPDDGHRLVWRVLPVVDTRAPAGEKRGVLGMVLAGVRVDRAVDISLAQLSAVGIDLSVLDETAPAGKRLLYHRRSRAVEDPSTNSLDERFMWETRIDVGGRAWTVAAIPTTEFVARRRSWRSWIVLAGGLIMTAAGSLFYGGGIRRTLEIESLVAERTHALSLEVAEQRRLKLALKESEGRLTVRVGQLDRRNKEIGLLNEVGDMLQSCVAIEEAYPIIAGAAPDLLPGTSGALYMLDAREAVFAAAAEWGPEPPAGVAFKADDCWALRRGRVHAVDPGSSAPPCIHAPDGGARGSFCAPLNAAGKTIGLLHAAGCPEEAHAFATSMAEHVALALSNLMLRSDLKQLSVHDPLTSLYNRRYMEEALELEIRRAQRKEGSIGVVMLDIDHFKSFNDTFGHGAGDELLRSLADMLKANLRAGDIACRYGGEEFVLILPEAGVEAATRRAEGLRERVKALDVRYLDRSLGNVSLSLGVATYPVHGGSRDQVVEAADAALYRAKEGGRDRVVVASTEPPA